VPPADDVAFEDRRPVEVVKITTALSPRFRLASRIGRRLSIRGCGVHGRGVHGGEIVTDNGLIQGAGRACPAAAGSRPMPAIAALW